MTRRIVLSGIVLVMVLALTVPALAQVQSDETVGGVRDSLRDATTEEER